jgi:hypothetical protein
MQNNFGELYALMSWTRKGCLGPGDRKDFLREVARPIQMGQRADAYPAEVQRAHVMQAAVVGMLSLVVL